MKYVLTLLIIASFLSCSSNCVCKMQSANVDVVQAMYDGFAEGNIDAVLAQMSEDITWNEAENFIYADKNPYIGPQAVLEGIFTRIGEEWEYWNLEDMTVQGAGNSNVVAQGRYKAKNNSTGKELNAQFVHYWTVEDGKATSFQQYADTKQTAEAIMSNEIQRISINDFPADMVINHIDDWGGMTVAVNSMPAGTDFGPLLEGLENNSCHVPHWGYILKGKLNMKYDDGEEGVLKKGDLFFMPAGHTGVVIEDVKLLDFSPEKGMGEVISHIEKKVKEFSEQ